MFKQNPHPFYKALLENDYSVVPATNPQFFKWYCGGHELTIFNQSGIFCVRDNKTGESGIISFILDNFENNLDDVKKLIKKHFLSVKESLIQQKVDAMGVVLTEILKTSMNIKSFNFSPGTFKNKKFLRIIDENDNVYKIYDKKTTDLIFNFYFVDGLSLRSEIEIESFSNHDFLENFAKHEDLKKVLDINPKIEKIS